MPRQDDLIDEVSLVDPAMTVADVVDALVALGPRLDKIADALEVDGLVAPHRASK